MSVASAKSTVSTTSTVAAMMPQSTPIAWITPSAINSARS
ncbi:hypothetical protein ACVWXL_006158 [Bradyrhizobium sp. GM22.5]